MIMLTTIAARRPRYHPRYHKAAPQPEPWQAIHRVADTRVRAMAGEIRQSIEDVRAGVSEDALAEALTLGDVNAALATVDVRRMQPGLIRAVGILNDAFQEAGAVAGTQLLQRLGIVEKAKTKVELRFDMTNPHAQEWASRNAARLVTRVSEETRNGIRQAVERGFKDGIAPRQLAKIIRETGVGLNRPQINAWLRVRDRLIADGASKAHINKVLSQLYERQIRYRTLMIARHELLQASNQGQSTIWRESEAAGLIPSDTKRKWIITPDDRLCELCGEMRGDRAITGMNEPWDTPTGEVMIPQQIHPQCRCSQGLVVDLNVAPPMARAAIANPTPQLQALMPGLGRLAAVVVGELRRLVVEE